ncbi:putative 29,3 kDa protein in ccpA 3'region ORF1 [Proteiniborus sp. DW1]|uniref:motility protein A n=1 Tax=Proteiniborus sp. DW1 TaxID=1889883 RepID=UPI00092E05CA|nr:motility protein A [Proteiniborus sp. DW1]SCG83444.1 putative 29,3 kDa protein in ccpA 3'region ORF1 [Proteiniborus sp. DW1]
MDIATIIGFIAAIGFIVWGIMDSGNIANFYDFPSIVITLGGTVAATLISFPLKKIIGAMKAIKKALFVQDSNPSGVINQLIELSNLARREGLLALEEAGEKANDEFLKKGIMLIVDGTDPELVRNILETELNFLEERHKEGQGVFEAMGTYSPAFGMVGTLIGLVNMLKELEDVSSVGPSMSVALITTFYGSFLANAVFLPLANKLKGKSSDEVLVKELMLEGLLSIQAGENPRIIEEKLKTFLPPDLRRSYKKEISTEEAL